MISERRIVQITIAPGSEDYHPWLAALCSDGTVWQYVIESWPQNCRWQQLPPIPQESAQ